MSEQPFCYRALDNQGRRSAGVILSASQEAAFDALKANGLSPIVLRPAPASAVQTGLAPREAAGLLADLAALLRAGADMRSALTIIAPSTTRGRLAQFARDVSGDIAGGGAIDEAFRKRLPEKLAFVAALISAGEAAGDLSGGLERAAEMLESQIEAREKLVGILAYPLFVLTTAIAAFLVIIFFVVPSLEPLARAPGAEPGLPMRMLLAASTFLRTHLTALAIGGAGLVLVGLGGGIAGVWGRLWDRFLLRGPLRFIAGPLVYGAYAVALGGVLAAGSPMTEALRLSLRTVRSPTARKTLQPLLAKVRDGQSLSSALDQVAGFPATIRRLVTIGERSGALGPMLLRAGRLEERKALRLVEALGRVVGPLLIVGLGGLIGLLMAGLLSGVSGLGQGALD